MELTRNNVSDRTLETCRQTMNTAAKSFSLASVFFSKEAMSGAQLLYGWCRYCDDQIDEAPSSEEASQRLEHLQSSTRLALEGKASDQNDYFKALSFLADRYKIPEYYAMELLAGMKMDSSEFKYNSEKELDLYCFRVAGVVGLMMTHIMGVNDENALDEAVAAGIAMQLTNISRDILEDFENNRIYIPKSWFEEMELNYPPRDREELIESAYALAPKLVFRAEEFYTKGKEGLIHLPFRAALAISSAIEIYSAIGHKVILRGRHAWNTRTYIPKWKKVLLAAKGMARVFLQIPRRVVKPWKPVPLNKVWRFK